MNKRSLLVTACAAACLAMCETVAAGTLKDVLGKYFTVGAAVSSDVVWGRNGAEAKLVTDNFNSIVAENCMKGERIHPEEDTYFWDDADRTVKFAEDNGLEMIGHCLVWHSQPP